MVGLYVCLWVAYACSKREKSKKEVGCRFQIYVKIASGMPMNHPQNFGIIGGNYSIIGQFLSKSVEMTSFSDLPKITFERDVNGAHAGR